MASKKITCRQVAEFRHSILGELFARPPAKGELAERLRELSNKSWVPPGQSHPEQYCVRTLERWYAKVRKNPSDRVTALLPSRRSDLGIRHAVRPDHIAWLKQNIKDYSHWNIKLRSDNLSAVESLLPTPSYSTVLRWFHAHGVYSTGIRGVHRKKTRETLSFESAFPGEVWHMDMHKGSRKILLPNGNYATAICIAYLDDHSRYCCHCQWVLLEDTDALVHITRQAFLKHGLPSKIHSDNGSAMISAEYETGLQRLGIRHERIIPRAAFQNGKIESFWNPIEGRLLKMLSRVEPLTLDILNQYTQPWVTFDYNQSIHSETGQKPIDRYMTERNVTSRSPDYNELGRAFRRVVSRLQRLSDGTVSLDGVTFQVPRAFRHMRKLHIAYCQWDLSSASIVDEQTHIEAAPLFPIDKNRNADGRRAPLPNLLEVENGNENTKTKIVDSNVIPPLLSRYMKDFEKQSPVAGFIPHQKEPS